MTGAATSQVAEPYTYADLQAMPDDHYRRELIDGQLLVTPSPASPHQRAISRLLVLLDAATPDDLEVLVAPMDWKLSETTVVEPDVLVTHADDVGGPYLTQTPVLVVEVLSPSTRITDLNNKKALYERAGVPRYWVVDPEVPGLDVFALEGGRYLHLGRWGGEQVYADSCPASLTSATTFEVEVTPVRLIGPR
jgi:Uma2 family endonuclease